MTPGIVEDILVSLPGTPMAEHEVTGSLNIDEELREPLSEETETSMPIDSNFPTYKRKTSMLEKSCQIFAVPTYSWVTFEKRDEESLLAKRFLVGENFCSRLQTDDADAEKVTK